MINTQVTWAVSRENFTFDAECRDKAVELGGASLGDLIESDPFTVQRRWANEDIANEWISFVLALGAASAVIVPDATDA
jgi:hypothetical protein